MGFTCGFCGQYHDDMALDIALVRPAEYFTVPEEEREARVFFDPDFCVIDNKVFVIRGVLPLPIQGSEEAFRWGVWAVVSEQDFKRYFELWDAPDAHEEPPFLGRLSGGINSYAESDLLPVKVQLQSDDMRPIFTVISEEHPLGADQRHGIPPAKVHQWIEMMQAKASKHEE